MKIPHGCLFFAFVSESQLNPADDLDALSIPAGSPMEEKSGIREIFYSFKTMDERELAPLPFSLQ